jgi:hypothetical protein
VPICLERRAIVGAAAQKFDPESNLAGVPHHALVRSARPSFFGSFSMNHEQCLHVLLFQEMPGVWIGRALEHDMVAEASTIGEALRAIVRLVEAHSEFDRRHRREPLSAFGGAPASCWSAFTSGTPLTISQLGIEHPGGWHIVAAIAHRRPTMVPATRDTGIRAMA